MDVCYTSASVKNVRLRILPKTCETMLQGSQLSGFPLHGRKSDSDNAALVGRECDARLMEFGAKKLGG